jgi:hypothetical protein
MRDLFIRRIYTSYGISIVVELDFVKKTVSLTEKDGGEKRWVFAGRTPEYLNGWRAIMKSMEYAVEMAQKEMADLDERETAEFVEMYQKLDKALQKGEGNPDARD